MNNVLVHNWFFDIAVERRALPLGFHTQLMQAITGVDPLAADESMRAHVQYGVEETLQKYFPPQQTIGGSDVEARLGPMRSKARPFSGLR
jgi:DNA-binding FadR family transcriptional regulator